MCKSVWLSCTIPKVTKDWSHAAKLWEAFKCRFLGLRDSNSVGKGWSLGICICYRSPFPLLTYPQRIQTQLDHHPILGTTALIDLSCPLPMFCRDSFSTSPPALPPPSLFYFPISADSYLHFRHEESEAQSMQVIPNITQLLSNTLKEGFAPRHSSATLCCPPRI